VATSRELQEQKRLVDAVNESIKLANESLLEQVRIHGLIQQKAEGAALDMASVDAEISAAYREAGSNLRTGSEDLQDGVGGFAAGASEAAEGMATVGAASQGLLSNIEKTWDGAGKSISSYVDDENRRAVSEIQRQFGGLGEDINVGAHELSNQMRKIVRATYEDYTNVGDTAFRIQNQPIQMAFNNLEDYMSYFNKVAYDPINSLRMTRDATEETVREMAVFGKGLGLSQDQIGTFVQRQISLTGKAGTDMLREAAAAAKGIEARTGISSKLISKNIEGIIADTQNFGNVSVQEAARISTALLQIGIDYQDLGSMLGKFQGFDQAAGAVSNLTSVFGLQMDAMAMMESANTDQDKFLRDMRESFLAAGKSVDTLTLYEKRFIQSQLGLKDVESVERLLDPRAAISGMEDLAAASEDMDPKDSLAAVTDDIDMIRDAAHLSGEALRTMVERDLTSGMQDAALSVEQSTSHIAAELTEMASTSATTMAEAAGVNGEIPNTMVDGFTEAYGRIESKFDAMIKRMKELWKDSGLAGKSESEVSRMMREGFDASFDRIDAGAQNSFSNMTDIATKELKKQVKTSGTMYNEMAKQIGRLGASYSDLTKEERKSLAERMKLGEDWEEELQLIFNSQAASAERQTMADQETAKALLEQIKSEGGAITEDTISSVREMLPASSEEIRDFVSGGTTTWSQLASSADAQRKATEEATAAQAEAAAGEGRRAATGGLGAAATSHIEEIRTSNQGIFQLLVGDDETIEEEPGGTVANVLAINSEQAQESSSTIANILELTRRAGEEMAESVLEQSVESASYLLSIKELLSDANTAAQTSEVPVQLTIQIGREKLEQVLGISPGETIVTFGNVE